MSRAFAYRAEQARDLKAAAMFRQVAADEGDHYDRYNAALETLQRH